MHLTDYTAANRRSWNETAAIHAAQNLAGLLEKFQQPGYNYLDPIATEIVQHIGLTGKAVAQLCCNNGRELLSIKNLGAGRCVGFDIADEFIQQAKQLRAVSGLSVEFIATDIYQVSADYDQQFDLVVVTIGALGWLPDLAGFFKVIARLLKPGGSLFIYEMHPILDMFEGEDKTDPPPLRHSYFRQTPYIDDTGLDYWSMTDYPSETSYWFHHKLSDILTQCLAQGFTLQSFQEYEHDISNVFAHFEHLTIKPPLCYTLVAKYKES